MDGREDFGLKQTWQATHYRQTNISLLYMQTDSSKLISAMWIDIVVWTKSCVRTCHSLTYKGTLESCVTNSEYEA